ncbi:MAG: hypothetical protein HQ564_03570 [Candidatus Saganbacteria bacterium]|nr:hypothetical protein [Candidatus Saganbacteria bacterium]
MKQEIVAVVAVREGSIRVKDKNFRPFASEKSLLHLKISQLKKSGCFDHIYVTSDSRKAKEIAQELGVEFLERDHYMCKGDTPWSEVVHYIASSVPGDPIICWANPTSPFQADYADAVKKFLEIQPEYNSLISVEEVREFFVNSNGRPANHNWGFWHERSQDLEKLNRMTTAIFIAKKSDMISWHYMIGTKVFLYYVSKTEGIDIDTPEDFSLAEKIYLCRSENERK